MCLCRRDVQDLVIREAVGAQRLLNRARKHDRNALLLLIAGRRFLADGRWQFLPRLRFGHRSLGLWFGLRRGLLLWVQVRPHFGGGQLGFGFAWRGLLVRWNDVRREKVDVIFARSRSFRRGVE